MYSIVPPSHFKKALKAALRCGYDISRLEEVVSILAEGKSLFAKYKDYALIGNYAGC